MENIAEFVHNNPKYLPAGRWSAVFDGVTRHGTRLEDGTIERTIRINFAVQTQFHGRRRFYKMYYNDSARLENDIRHFFGNQYHRVTRKGKLSLPVFNEFTGISADIFLVDGSVNRRGQVQSYVAQFHPPGHFRKQALHTSASQ